MLIELGPNLLNQGQVVLGGLSAADEDGRTDQIQSVVAGAKITLDLVAEVRVAVQNAFVQINQGLGAFAFPVRLEDVGQRVVGCGKRILGEVNRVSGIQPNVTTNGGIGGGHYEKPS